MMTSYLCFWDWNWNVHYGICFYIEYVTLSRLIVLYSQCRVNRNTNLFVVLYYVIFCFASTTHLGLLCWASPTCRVRPHYAAVHSITLSLYTSLCPNTIIKTQWPHLKTSLCIKKLEVGSCQQHLRWSNMLYAIMFQNARRNGVYTESVARIRLVVEAAI